MTFTCCACGRPISKTKTHYLIEPLSVQRVVCSRCVGGSTRHLHAKMFGECEVAWHDLHDHRIMFATYAGARSLFKPKVAAEASQVRLSELLEARECSPMCLMGQEEGRCKCVCGGTWHGAVLTLDPLISRRDAPDVDICSPADANIGVPTAPRS